MTPKSELTPIAVCVSGVLVSWGQYEGKFVIPILITVFIFIPFFVNMSDREVNHPNSQELNYEEYCSAVRDLAERPLETIDHDFIVKFQERVPLTSILAVIGAKQVLEDEDIRQGLYNTNEKKTVSRLRIFVFMCLCVRV